jgi:hypothetical protein
MKRMRQRAVETNGGQRGSKLDNEAVDFMIAGAISKTVACCLAYPHGKLLILEHSMDLCDDLHSPSNYYWRSGGGGGRREARSVGLVPNSIFCLVFVYFRLTLFSYFL